MEQGNQKYIYIYIYWEMTHPLLPSLAQLEYGTELLKGLIILDTRLNLWDAECWTSFQYT